MNLVSKIFSTFRPSTVLLSLMVFFFLYFNSEYSLAVILFQTLSFYFGTAAGMMINDIFDSELDKVKQKDANNQVDQKVDDLKKRLVLLFAISVFSIAVQLIFFKNFPSLLFYFLTVAAVVGYTPLIKHKIGLMKTPFVAAMSISPLVFSIFYSFSGFFNYLPALVLTFLFFLGRENFLDYRDRKSDLEFGIKTLYYYFPDNLGLAIAFGLMISATFLSIFVIDGDVNLILAVSNFIYCSLMILYFLRKKEIWIIRKGTLLTILFFILSLYLPALGFDIILG